MKNLAHAALALVLAASAVTALAADTPGPQACRSDARKLCGDAKPGGGRLLACLKQHEAELSSQCKATLPALQQCAKEVQTICGSSGRREMRECLRSHADQFSAECRARQS